MKKLLSLFLILTILISCVGCGKTKSANGEETTTENTTTTTTTETSATTTTQESSETSEKTQESDTTEKKETTTKKKTETTTKKKTETTTKKQETTTKKPVSAEPDFEYEYKKVKDGITYYYVIDETGDGYYMTASGKRWAKEVIDGETVTYNPDDLNYDHTICSVCGSKDCWRSVLDYYCVICKKNIPGYECHPEEHFDASH